MNSRNKSRAREYLISVLSVIAVAGINFLASNLIGYRVTALFLLVTVSLLAMVYDIYPVLVAALLSALIWDFFFIPPRFHMTVSSGEDLLLLFMYLVIVMLSATFTFQIRQKEKQLRKKEEKEKAIKLYNTLLNSLSHELRTPIATIIGAADTLKDNKEKLSSENSNELLNEISIASLRLNYQVENLLNMSRIESGVLKPKYDWCDINEIIYSAIHKLEKKSAQYHFVVDLQKELPLFKLDYGLMEQVIFNLLNNAVSYTPPGSTIHIKATCTTSFEGIFEEKGRIPEIKHNKTTTELVLVIADNGPGFPPDEIKYAFDKFYRLKEALPGGTGLGLSIAKGFVEAHRGKIELSNVSTGGAEFTIRIPTEITYTNLLKNE
jgi:two-component system sensor histidine kinase KdpD